jgi:hypothetical protein
MAGISESKAMAAKRRGEGFAKHLGLAPGSDRYNAVKFGTARKAGWRPSREVRGHGREMSLKEARHHLRRRRSSG